MTQSEMRLKDCKVLGEELSFNFKFKQNGNNATDNWKDRLLLALRARCGAGKQAQR